MPSPAETAAFISALEPHLPGLAARTFVKKNTTGNEWWNDFLTTVENSGASDAVAHEPEDADWPTADEVLTVLRYQSNALGKQRLKKAQAKQLLLGLRRGAAPAAEFKAAIICALRVAYAAGPVYVAIEDKLEGCAKADEIFGSDLSDTWGERHTQLDDRSYDDDKKELLEAVAARDVQAVSALLEDWETLDC